MNDEKETDIHKLIYKIIQNNSKQLKINYENFSKEIIKNIFENIKEKVILKKIISLIYLIIINIEVKDEAWRKTPLHNACKQGQLTIFEYFISKGANIEEKDDFYKRNVYNNINV